MPNFEEIDAYLWSQVPERIDSLVEKCAAAAWDIRSQAGSIYTRNHVGYYWNPEIEKAAIHIRPVADVTEASWCKSALDRAVGADHVQSTLLSDDDVVDGTWIKVAYSPTLARMGELLNFFPSKDVPWNKPSPLAAMLTSGLMGAGLGYGLGWAGEKVMPEKMHRAGRTRKSLAVLGALMGASPGALWAIANQKSGLPVNSGELLKNKVDRSSRNRIDVSDWREKASASFIKHAFDPFGHGSGAENVQPVNINRLGQTLWDVGATPQTAAATMSSVYAAQQLPGGVGPGYVTPRQTGLLGTMMGAAGGGAKGYATGWAVGKGLGLLTGMPPGTQTVLKRTGAALGIINTLVPRLFN